MTTRKNSAATIERIKIETCARAAHTRGLLRMLHPHVAGTVREEPLNAALELLDAVPRALNNTEAKTLMARVGRLLPSIIGLTEPRLRPY